MSKEILPLDESGKSQDGGLWLPEDEVYARGLVPAGERAIIRNETRWPLLAALAGTIVPPLGKWHREVYIRVLKEEMGNLLKEMTDKGLIGEHPLVQSSIIREKFQDGSGSFSGSLFSISGGFETHTRYASKILFAWQSVNGKVILSEANTHMIEIGIEKEREIPTVEFEFDSTLLLSQPLYAGGALVRKSFRHPNGYLRSSLVKATIRGKSEEHINQFLLAAPPQKS